MLVKADHRTADAVMMQKDAGMPGILRGDDVSLFQRFQSPQGDVLQIPNRGWDDRQQSRLPALGEFRREIHRHGLSRERNGLGLGGR